MRFIIMLRVVVCYQAVGATNPTEALDHCREHFEAQLSIWVDKEDVLPRVAAVRWLPDSIQEVKL
jgi:hypothetical protein